MAEWRLPVVVDQCSILYLKPCWRGETHTVALRSLGFAVTELEDLPSTETLATYHAVICRVAAAPPLTNIGARLRAKRHFGRRVLVALVDAARTEREKRDAVNSGFDCVLPDACSARDLAAAILRHLRPFPEYRCLLKPPRGGRRKAA